MRDGHFDKRFTGTYEGDHHASRLRTFRLWMKELENEIPVYKEMANYKDKYIFPGASD